MTDARAQFVDVEVLQARRPQTMPQTRWPVQSVHVVGCVLSKSIQGRCVSTLETQHPHGHVHGAVRRLCTPHKVTGTTVSRI